MILRPSIASANVLEIGKEIMRLKDWNYLHLDIEDGNFTPNITFGLKMVGEIAGVSRDKELDVHLMVTNPFLYLESLAMLGIQMVAAHIEALDYPLQFIHQVHKLGMQAGLALNIKTPSSVLEPFAGIIDYALFMSAEADSQGEILFSPAIDKAVSARHMLPTGLRIQIDGGISEHVMKKLYESGINDVVLGRLAFGHGDPYIQLCKLKNNFRESLNQRLYGGDKI